MLVMYSVARGEGSFFRGGDNVECAGTVPTDTRLFHYKKFGCTDCLWMVPGTVDPSV